MKRPEQKLWKQSPAVFCGLGLMGLVAAGGEIYFLLDSKANDSRDPKAIMDNVRTGLKADLGSLCVVSGDLWIRAWAKNNCITLSEKECKINGNTQ